MTTQQLNGLRVLFANSTMIRSAQGGEKECILQQARALKAEGAEVDILTNYYEPENAKEFQEFNVITLGLKRPNMFLGFRDMITLLRYWTMSLKKYDLFIGHDFPAYILARRIQPAIYYSHVPNRTLHSERAVYIKKLPIYLRPLAWIYTAILCRIDISTIKKVGLILANSKDAQDKIKNTFGRDSTIISPGVHIDDDVQPNFKKFILTASRLEPEKEIDAVVKAMKYLPDYELIVAGEGSQKQKLMELASSISDKIQFIGRVDRAKLTQLYRDCFCVINVSRQEVLGMVGIEAQANGKMVIGAKGTGMLEYAGDPRTVLLLDDTSPENIAKTVRQLEKLDLLEQAKLCIAYARIFDWKNFRAKFISQVFTFLGKSNYNHER